MIPGEKSCKKMAIINDVAFIIICGLQNIYIYI